MTSLTSQIESLKAQITAINNQITSLQASEQDIQNVLKPLIQQMEDEVRNTPEAQEFIKQCDALGCEMICIDLENDDSVSECIEDDGTLHISKGKIRGCFICNQDIRKAEWIKLARPIVKAFGFQFSKLAF